METRKTIDTLERTKTPRACPVMFYNLSVENGSTAQLYRVIRDEQIVGEMPTGGPHMCSLKLGVTFKITL